MKRDKTGHLRLTKATIKRTYEMTDGNIDKMAAYFDLSSDDLIKWIKKTLPFWWENKQRYTDVRTTKESGSARAS